MPYERIIAWTGVCECTVFMGHYTYGLHINSQMRYKRRYTP